MIAEFMGFKKHNDFTFEAIDERFFIPTSIKNGEVESYGYVFPINSLCFHTSWDWLMPVVEKIEDFYIISGKELEFQVVQYEDEVKIIAKYLDKKWETIVEISADGSGKKKNTYQAVIKFIEWYNEQSNNENK